VRYGFIRAQQKAYPVTVLCAVMQVSKSAYYAWAKQPEATGQAKEAGPFEQRVVQIFEDSKKTYGSRRIASELQKSGVAADRYKVRSAMARLGLQARYPKRFKVTTDSHHSEAISPNRLDRQFDVAAPNQVWTTDITYVWTLEGWLYVAIVVDLFSRQVVGWAADSHRRASLCVQALQMAFGRRKPAPGLLHHRPKAAHPPAANTASTCGR
jgi:transposase InsO family protein